MTVWAPLKYLLAAILLLMLGLTPFSRAVRGGVSAFFGPFVFGFYKISQGLVSEVYFWKDLRGLAVENTLLQKQVAYLKSQTVRLDETARENEVLKKQFNGKINDWQGDLIMARVLGWGQTTAASSKTIILNGPMGIYEIKNFSKGTKIILQALKDNKNTTILGGGDTVDAIIKLGFKETDFHHVSSGGGASIEFLEGKILVGIKPLLK